MGRGLKGRLTLRAVSYRMACTAHVEFFRNDFAGHSCGGPRRLLMLAKHKEHLCARCVCGNVHAVNPAELPDVDKPLYKWL